MCKLRREIKQRLIDPYLSLLSVLLNYSHILKTKKWTRMFNLIVYSVKHSQA